MTYWFRGRRRHGLEALEGYEGSKPSKDEADEVRMRLIADGVIAGGALIALFVLLAWLESLFS